MLRNNMECSNWRIASEMSQKSVSSFAFFFLRSHKYNEVLLGRNKSYRCHMRRKTNICDRILPIYDHIFIPQPKRLQKCFRTWFKCNPWRNSKNCDPINHIYDHIFFRSFENINNSLVHHSGVNMEKIVFSTIAILPSAITFFANLFWKLMPHI